MNWCDEKYVKLYTRNTATWVLWPWQARAIFPHLLRATNYAGVLETGNGDRLVALSALIMMPVEVIEAGVAAMLETGTLEAIRSGFLMPKYIEAQEATKTERAKKRDQRERQRTQARESPEAPVPSCPDLSRVVPLQPTTTTTTTTSPPPPPPPARLSSMSTEKPVDDRVEIIADGWNALPKPFKKIKRLSPKRRIALKARLAGEPDVSTWLKVIAAMPSVPFLRGEGPRRWVATFDWLLKPDSLTKLEEGLYADSGAPAPRPKSLPPARAEDSNAAFDAMAHLTPDEREQLALKDFAS